MLHRRNSRLAGLNIILAICSIAEGMITSLRRNCQFVQPILPSREIASKAALIYKRSAVCEYISGTTESSRGQSVLAAYAPRDWFKNDSRVGYLTVAAVAEGDGEPLFVQFRSDEIQNGTSLHSQAATRLCESSVKNYARSNAARTIPNKSIWVGCGGSMWSVGAATGVAAVGSAGFVFRSRNSRSFLKSSLSGSSMLLWCRAAAGCSKGKRTKSFK